MECLDAETLFELFARGAALREREALELHLDACAACRELVAAYARAADELSDALTLPEDAVAPTIDGAANDPDAPGGLRTVLSGPREDARTPASPGQRVGGRYLLDAVVGEGGMGVVWAATDAVSGARVALKVLKEPTPELTRRSLREARASTRVGHPSLIEVLDVLLPEGGGPILVMPLLEGESLDVLLSRRQKLSPEETLTILDPVVDGMAAAHARGVIHRDLKPPNVFLAADGSGQPSVVVLDFGLAKIVGGTDEGADKLTRTGAVLGTPFYMAPEQLFGDARIDGKADVWAIGAMLYECLSGRRPIEGRSYGQVARNVARGSIVPLVDLVPALDPQLAALSARMLAKDPEGRPTLAEVHADFRDTLRRLGLSERG